MEQHADFAVPVSQKLYVETALPHPDSSGTISGQAIALGWWVDPQAGSPDNPSAGTLYLVVDPTAPRPLWVKEGDIVSCSIAN
jgi:hypothetical protein